MKVSVLSESPADESALHILLRRILGEDIEKYDPFRLRSRGWPSVVDVLPSVIKHLHYRSDVEALVVVVDSNKSVLHEGKVDEMCDHAEECRLCRLRTVIRQVCGQLKEMPARQTLKVASGVAVPAIEAWYLCGIDMAVTEAAWRQGFESGSFPFTTNELKKRVYGTDRPPLAVETRHAVEEARRLAQNLHLLETYFPTGFGSLVFDIQKWKK
jgi:hypothetical protein